MAEDKEEALNIPEKESNATAKALSVQQALDTADEPQPPLPDPKPSPKSGGVGDVHYYQLIKNNKLAIGVGFGYDAMTGYSNFTYYLKKTAGFERKTEGVANDQEVWIKTVNMAFPDERREIQLEVEVINEKTATPRAKFMRFIKEKQVLIYGGHARWGSGFDFDSLEDKAENIDLTRDLPKAGIPANEYRLWCFLSCKSLRHKLKIRRMFPVSKYPIATVYSKENIYSDWPDAVIQTIIEQGTLYQMAVRLDEYEHEHVVKNLDLFTRIYNNNVSKQDPEARKTAAIAKKKMNFFFQLKMKNEQYYEFDAP